MSIFMHTVERIYLRSKNNLVFYDQLTGVYNNNWLMLIGQEKYRNKNSYVTVLDLDGLKNINDTYGHLYGNNVIYNLANELKNLSMHGFEYLDIVRFGGDEFILFTDINPSSYIKTNVTSKISFGTIYKSYNMTVETAINNADLQMYDYKNRKKEKGFN